MLVNGKPALPFNMRLMPKEATVSIDIESIKQLSYLKYGQNKEEVNTIIMAKYQFK